MLRDGTELVRLSGYSAGGSDADDITGLTLSCFNTGDVELGLSSPRPLKDSGFAVAVSLASSGTVDKAESEMFACFDGSDAGTC